MLCIELLDLIWIKLINKVGLKLFFVLKFYKMKCLSLLNIKENRNSLNFYVFCFVF